MQLTNFAIKQSTTVYVLIVMIIIGGLISYAQLPREAAPDIAIPIVIVSTPYFGVSPVDIERLVTKPLEKEMKGIRNLKRLNSTSAESVSLVTLEFEPDVDIEEALQKVRDKVDKAKPDLPKDAEEPEIIEVNASDWPVLIANVSGNMDPVRLKAYAEDMKDEIEKIPGVLRADVVGGVEREIQVLVDPAKLRFHKISVNQIIGGLQAENINLPGGNIALGEMKYTVRVPGEFSSVDEMNDIVLKAPNGNPVYLRDVAEIVDTFEERETVSRLTTWHDGKEKTESNISVAVVKRSGENIIEVANRSKEVIKKFKDRTPEGIEILIINDMSEVILASVHDLENNIISGLLLVLLVLFFFMGGARNAAFVAISVPLSMLISFLVLNMLGITLNMVVLFALILALGMLVDNAIVIVENIYRHASTGKDRVQAAMDGTAEVGWAVVASTATTVAAFFPMTFWPGVMGEFMSFLPKTVIVVLLSSLFVALIVNPVLCATFLKVRDDVSYDEDVAPSNRIYDAYRSALGWSLDHKIIIVVVSFVALVVSLVAFGRANLGAELFPEATPERFQVAIETPDGTNLETTDALVRRIETTLNAKPDLVEAWIGDSGVQAGQGFAGSGQAPHYGKVTVDLVDVGDQPQNPFEFMAALRKAYKDIPGATITIETESMGPPAGAPVNVEIVGEDLQILAKISREVRDRIRNVPGVIDLRDNVELARPEVHVEVDRQRAAIAGVDTRGVAQTIRTAVNGTKATVYRDGDDEYDVVVRLPEDQRHSVEDLALLTVVNRDEFHIPVTEVATIVERGGSGSIRRKDQERVVTVSGGAADGYLPADLLKVVQKRVEDIELPAGYEIRYTGENEDQAEAAEFIMFALMAALFLILLVLVTEFNSVTQPLIILGSVILSLIGVLWAHILYQLPFGIIMSGIGVISLAGIVVNNAIVMIDYINRLRDRGYELREAVVHAGLIRFRPIMLTAITTVLGLVPLVVGVSLDFVNFTVVFGGRSVETWGPMAKVITFGLSVATILTLIVVPVSYALLEGINEHVARVKARRVAAAVGVMLILIVPWTLQAQVKPATDIPTADASDIATDGPAFTTPEDIETKILRGDVPLKVDVGAKRVLDLDAALLAMEEKNLDVQSAKVQIEIANAGLRQAYSTVFPNIFANGNVTINQEEIVANFGPDPSTLPAGTPSSEIVIQPKVNYQWVVGATMRANLRALALIDVAYLQVDMAEKQVRAVEHALRTAVIETYYGLLTVRALIELTAEQVASASTALEVATRKKAAGTATDFEVTRARLRKLQTENELESTKLQFKKVREGLANLLQEKADFDVVTPTTRLEAQNPEIIKSNARENRTDIQLSAMGVEINEALKRETFYKYFPALSATFQYAGAKGTALSPAEARWSIILGAQWTIWDGGLREGEYQERKAQILAADFERQKLINTVDSNVETTYAEYLSAKTQVSGSQTQLELAGEALRQAKTAYKYGAATQLDVINAEDQLKFAQIGWVQNKLQAELALRKLDQLAEN